MKYQIKIAGVLDQSWSDWLGSVEMASEQVEDGSMVTILMVVANDQSKLFGILDHLRDLNFALIAVSSIEYDEKKQEARDEYDNSR